MKHIFEDSKDHILAKFFEKAYPNTRSSLFCYSESCGNIPKFLSKNIKHDECVIIYLDMAPGNPELKRTYLRICKTLIDYPNAIILPVICREYYFLKSLYNKGVIRQNNWYLTCINKHHFNGTNPNIVEYLESLEDDSCINFENFCKAVTRVALEECCNLNTSVTEASRPFYFKDCPCSNPIESCKQESVCSRACDFVLNFPYFPGGSYITPDKKTVVDISDLRTIHKELINQINEFDKQYCAECGENFIPVKYMWDVISELKHKQKESYILKYCKRAIDKASKILGISTKATRRLLPKISQTYNNLINNGIAGDKDDINKMIIDEVTNYVKDNIR